MRIKELLLTLVAILVVASCGLLPCTQPRHGHRQHSQSMNILKMIGLALHNYHDTHRKWPPAVVTDKQGKPLFSWRVLLLPFLEQDRLYQQFKLDEPWDSAANRKLLDKMPWCYLLPASGDPAGTTRYQAIVGPGTAWERPDLGFDHGFPDGTENTIMVAEAANPVPWSKPTDLEFDPKGALPEVGGPYSVAVSHFFCYVTKRVQGFNALFVDAHVRFLRTDIDSDVLRAMLTRNGGEKVAVPGD